MTEHDFKTTTCLRLMEKVLEAAKCQSAPFLRQSIREISQTVEQLVEIWLNLASMEYACERVFNEFSDSLLRNYGRESFLKAVLNETITLTEEMKDKLCRYKKEFRDNYLDSATVRF